MLDPLTGEEPVKVHKPRQEINSDADADDAGLAG